MTTEIQAAAAQAVANDFADSFATFQREVHNTAVAKGWWNNPRNQGEAIALMHSELSEALEAMRAGVEAELADVVIRIMDFATGFGFDVTSAIVAKAAMNRTRPVMHGGKAF